VTNRRFTNTVYTYEKYDGTGTEQLRLKHHPIIVPPSVLLWVNNTGDNSDSWTAIASDRFWVNQEDGILTMTSDFVDFNEANDGEDLSEMTFTKGIEKYRVTYTAGYVTVPFNIQYACLMFVSEALNIRRAGGLVSESLGDHNVSFGSIMEKNQALKSILTGYKDYEV
jgi:hypothetical protein